ncbi:MAG: hypothetical protein UU34_C0019G0010 [Candidatus Curtissbacteria bacterium GW2011_GWA1_41_11]|uniref:Uncharacterized protein n=1 Tax=Candidatus Curtissbacteria bacterium GW2011_GWA1_41_11 TaxID=1618409 RepID=A0A0G0XES0_9BACT|nr:MAG: hypothetical protein UU34_C0019G0010 [Candidatus Curtissbacteria bacterium GW2011_GWA1_41_11]
MLKTAAFVIFLFISATYGIFAQGLPSISQFAVNLQIKDDQAKEGDILSITKEGLVRSSTAYDIVTFGVIVNSPVISIEPRSDSTSAVATIGVAQVKVSTKAGNIAVGDFIATSDDAGVGQKATKGGYVLGRALGSFDKSDRIETIPVEINIKYADAVDGSANGEKKGLLGLLSDPENFKNFLRYLAGFLIGFVTLVGTVYAFVKFLTNGITALGRNPMAKKTIISSMILSGFVITILAISGFGVALYIIGFRGF